MGFDVLVYIILDAFANAAKERVCTRLKDDDVIYLFGCQVGWLISFLTNCLSSLRLGSMILPKLYNRNRGVERTDMEDGRS